MSESPLAPDGRPVGLGLEERLSEFGAVSVTKVERVQVRLWKGRERKLRDRLSTSIQRLVISHQLYDLIHQFNVDETVHFLPADVLTSRGVKVNQYLFGYAIASHDILDYERANYRTCEGIHGPVVMDIKHWVAARDRIPPYDFFQSDPLSRWIVSDRLREAIEYRGMTGCRFDSIEISP